MPWPAQTAQTVMFIFSNVAYRATVYKTGVAADYNCVKRPGNPPHFAVVHCADKSTT